MEVWIIRKKIFWLEEKSAASLPSIARKLIATKTFKRDFYNVIYFISDLGKPVLLIVNYSKQGQGGAAQISYGLWKSVLFSKQSKCIHL